MEGRSGARHDRRRPHARGVHVRRSRAHDAQRAVAVRRQNLGPEDEAVRAATVITGGGAKKKYDGPKGKGLLSEKDLDAAAKKKLAALPDPPKLVTFGQAVRTRQLAGGGAESSHRVSTALNLANIAIRLGRTLHFDPATEQIIGDEVANRLVNIPMRAPWHL